MNSHQNAKNQLSLSVISSIYLVNRVATTISNHIHPNIFLSTLKFWYQQVKTTKLGYFITCSRDIFHFKSYNLIDENCFGPI